MGKKICLKALEKYKYWYNFLDSSSSSDLPDGRFKLINSEFAISASWYISSPPSSLQLQFSGNCRVWRCVHWYPWFLPFVYVNYTFFIHNFKHVLCITPSHFVIKDDRYITSFFHLMQRAKSTVSCFVWNLLWFFWSYFRVNREGISLEDCIASSRAEDIASSYCPETLIDISYTLPNQFI